MIKTISLGISACLLGENVRYDGGHALDRFLRDTLGRYVRYLPVCPEVECGFGMPREAMRLTGDRVHPRLVTIRTGVDHTDRLEDWAKTRVAELERNELCGFIFKSNSPSSGMERVKVYDAGNTMSPTCKRRSISILTRWSCGSGTMYNRAAGKVLTSEHRSVTNDCFWKKGQQGKRTWPRR